MSDEKTFTLEEVALELKALEIPHVVNGNPNRRQSYSFKSLREIGERGIFFLAKGIPNRPDINDSIILCGDSGGVGRGNVAIQVDDPQLVFYQLMEAMLGEKERRRGIHPTAIVDADAEVSPDAYVGPYCVLEKCIVKAGATLHSHVCVMRGSTIEENVTIEPHSTIGATGVAWVWDPKNHRKVIQPQTGYTIIGAGTFLGSDITVVRGSVNEATVIGEGCVIAHGTKIGHGARIGRGCHMANNVSIAGNVTLGDQCFLGSAAVVRPMIRLANGAVVGAGSVVVKDCEREGQLLVGVPAKPVPKRSGKMSGVPKLPE